MGHRTRHYFRDGSCPLDWGGNRGQAASQSDKPCHLAAGLGLNPIGRVGDKLSRNLCVKLYAIARESALAT